jgi:hypothetical protein
LEFAAFNNFEPFPQFLPGREVWNEIEELSVVQEKDGEGTSRCSIIFWHYAIHGALPWMKNFPQNWFFEDL